MSRLACSYGLALDGATDMRKKEASGARSDPKLIEYL